MPNPMVQSLLKACGGALLGWSKKIVRDSVKKISRKSKGIKELQEEEGPITLSCLNNFRVK